MNVRPSAEEFELLSAQLEDMRRAYPELFAYLRQRDAVLHRTLLWIPHPDDPEGYISMDRLGHVLEDLRYLPPGIVDLTRE